MGRRCARRRRDRLGDQAASRAAGPRGCAAASGARTPPRSAPRRPAGPSARGHGSRWTGVSTRGGSEVRRELDAGVGRVDTLTAGAAGPGEPPRKLRLGDHDRGAHLHVSGHVHSIPSMATGPNGAPVCLSVIWRLPSSASPAPAWPTPDVRRVLPVVTGVTHDPRIGQEWGNHTAGGPYSSEHDVSARPRGEAAKAAGTSRPNPTAHLAGGERDNSMAQRRALPGSIRTSRHRKPNHRIRDLGWPPRRSWLLPLATARPRRQRPAPGTGWPSARAAATGTSTPATATTAACSSPTARGRRLRWRQVRRPAPTWPAAPSRSLIAERVLDEQGWGAWPACSRKLGLGGEERREALATAEQYRQGQSTATPSRPTRSPRTTRPTRTRRLTPTG